MMKTSLEKDLTKTLHNYLAQEVSGDDFKKLPTMNYLDIDTVQDPVSMSGDGTDSTSGKDNPVENRKEKSGIIKPDSEDNPTDGWETVKRKKKTGSGPNSTMVGDGEVVKPNTGGNGVAKLKKGSARGKGQFRVAKNGKYGGKHGAPSKSANGNSNDRASKSVDKKFPSKVPVLPAKTKAKTVVNSGGDYESEFWRHRECYNCHDKGHPASVAGNQTRRSRTRMTKISQPRVKRAPLLRWRRK
jgi:hypothetical protein